MKKAIITIGIVAICTLVFLFSFRQLSGASSVDLENTDLIKSEGSEALTDEPSTAPSGEISDAEAENNIAENNGTVNNSTENNGGELSSGINSEIDTPSEDDDAVDLRAEEIKNYIKERIIPVIVGVLTSLSAVLASLGAIKKSLSRLSGARDDFKNEASERKSEFARQSALLEGKAKELSELARLLPQLENEIAELKKAQDKLNEEAYNIGKMVSLGFSGSYAVVKSGNGRKISALLSKCRALSGKEKDEDDIEGVPFDEKGAEASKDVTVGKNEEKVSVRTVKKTGKGESEALKNEEN